MKKKVTFGQFLGGLALYLFQVYFFTLIVYELFRKDYSIIFIVLFATLFAVFYPLIGRFFVFLSEILTLNFNNLAESIDKGNKKVQDNSEDNHLAFPEWTPSARLYLSLLAPITLLVLAFILLANLLMLLYKLIV